jgi:hypothetical protein
MNILLIFDIIIMVLIILFPYQFGDIVSVQSIDFENYLIITCIYSFIKSIYGIIILINKIIRKNKILYSKKYLLLLPSLLFSWLYSYFMLFKIIIDISFYLWGYQNNISDNIIANISIILSIIFTIGISMWLIKWTFYEKSIKKYIIIILNILTPIYLLKLAYEIFVSSM